MLTWFTYAVTGSLKQIYKGKGSGCKGDTTNRSVDTYMSRN